MLRLFRRPTISIYFIHFLSLSLKILVFFVYTWTCHVNTAVYVNSCWIWSTCCICCCMPTHPEKSLASCQTTLGSLAVHSMNDFSGKCHFFQCRCWTPTQSCKKSSNRFNRFFLIESVPDIWKDRYGKHMKTHERRKIWRKRSLWFWGTRDAQGSLQQSQASGVVCSRKRPDGSDGGLLSLATGMPWRRTNKVAAWSK